MNIKTELLEEYAKFVGNTGKQKANFEKIVVLFVIILSLFLFFFEYLMNNFFSSEQISKTGNLAANLILRQNKLDLMSRFVEIKSFNPKRGQDRMTKE